MNPIIYLEQVHGCVVVGAKKVERDDLMFVIQN